MDVVLAQRIDTDVFGKLWSTGGRRLILNLTLPYLKPACVPVFAGVSHMARVVFELGLEA
ncbi:hypothetical protein BPOR_0022g00050 [Botrytis porri]|uniref:Uncharacterized protein n=1 Tax=Botrytis porri TaxID=87229 RepID=A0A4Z1L468_9HELO|nr:hypothetical protein BPOR_0022g00050 [Botrytis porri]